MQELIVLKQTLLVQTKLNLMNMVLVDQTVEFNKKIAQLAAETCKEYSDKPRYVIGSMGPTGYLPSSNDPDLGLKTS